MVAEATLSFAIGAVNCAFQQLAAFLFVGEMSRKESMNEEAKARINEQNDKQLTARIEFVSPSPKVIDEFTRDVCDVLGQKGRRSFDNQHVRWAIADFMKLVSELTTNRLNKNGCEKRR